MTTPFSTAGLVAGSSELFQIFLYNLIGQVLGAVLTPLSREITEDLNTRFPNTPLSPEAVADMVVRSVVDFDYAIPEAARSGIDDERFTKLVANTGEPPGLEVMMEAVRRGFMEQKGLGAERPTLEQGIRESRVKNKYIQVLDKMILHPLPVADAIDAWVENQISPEHAKEVAFHNGISADDALILFHTRGRPPGPAELIEMVRRGFIPTHGTGPDATSLQQGIFESAVKDKWEPLYEHLLEYHPPPRTITALLRSGSITQEQASRLFLEAGLSAELAAAYVDNAHHQKIFADRALAKSDIEQLYRDQVLGRDDAKAMLQTMHWTAQEADYLLSLQDLKRVIADLNGAVGRVHNLYVNHKVTKDQALGALGDLHVPPAQVARLLAVWDVERTSNVKVLTSAEIASAFFYKVIDQDTAMAELTAQGWTPLDAWIILSVRVHQPLPNQPAPGPVPAGG